ncbi:heme acquisition protein HasA [Yersinia mollaretii]|uniref:heme acquisition protein HasA n=2 Tax=Yersinia mollaretii TaxID=33060 RepID=UPI0005E5E7CD|nr:heme acquisition protein HasA [Yersinia mollaretii]PJE87113.1 heme acquisition hemophore HasA [Yersinia mollaretii]CQD43772.1 hemophore HasA [Yersinia mollaretii]
MTVTIQYSSEFADSTLSSYTQAWATRNGDIRQAEWKDKGSFYGGFVADFQNLYTVGSSHGTEAAMIVQGNIRSAAVYYGKIENLELGDHYDFDIVSQQLDERQLKISGLDITSEYDVTKTMEENEQGETHQIIYGLMCGNATPLLEILQAKGIDINTPLKDMAIASLFDSPSEVQADAPIIGTIGITDDFDSAMLIAA